MRWLSITRAILSTLHAPEPPSHRKPRESRRLRTEFGGRSTRQRQGRRKPREGRRLQTAFTNSILKTFHAPTPPPAENHERVTNRILRTLHALAPPPAENHTRRSSITSRILSTLQAPAPPPAENPERVIEQNFEDFPRASAATRCQGHRLRKILRTLHAAKLRIRTAPPRERFDSSKRTQ